MLGKGRADKVASALSMALSEKSCEPPCYLYLEYGCAFALFRAGCIDIRFGFDSVNTARVDESISNGKSSEIRIGHQANATARKLANPARQSSQPSMSTHSIHIPNYSMSSQIDTR